MVEADAVGGKGIDVGGLVVLGPVAGKALPTHIVRHDEDNVWFSSRKGECCDEDDEE